MPPPGYKGNLLAALPATRLDLPALIHVTSSTVGRWIKILRESDQIHIGKWQRPAGGGSFQPVWYFGPGKDARCQFKPRTSKENSAKYRASIKGTEAGDIRANKKKAEYFARKALLKPCGWASSLLI